MPPTSSWTDIIDSGLLAPIVRFAEENPGAVRTVFLTGSYVRGTYNLRRPNVNVYFITTPGAGVDLRLGLGDLWQDVAAGLRERDVGFLVDCHPYTVTVRDPTARGLPTLTITTKVLDSGAAAGRYSLSPTIGFGWHLSHRVLYGDAGALEPFGTAPERDLAWFQGLHEALGHYRNILDHLPWALPWHQMPELLVEESLRYAEETIRDGAAVVLSADELRTGQLFHILFDWRGRAEPHFKERYGAQGVEAVRRVDIMKQAVDTGRPPSVSEARDTWRDALFVWHVVWERFRDVVTDEFGDAHGWLRRVNAFV